jgi:esterase FrsA
MSHRKYSKGLAGIAAAVSAVVLTAVAFNASAQEQWQTRTLPELKAETQARADRDAYPETGLKPDDVREALSHINSLDRDEWAAAWMAIGDRYEARAEGELAKNPTAARGDYYMAWNYYVFGRWPSPNSAGKKLSSDKAQAAFAAYGQLHEPKIEVLRIPFEGKEIVAYLQKPIGVAKPPLVLDIGGVDEWKDAVADVGGAFLKQGIADVAVDMPGTGEAPLPGRPGSERMYTKLIDYLKTRSDLDGNRIMVRGVSWGSYWSARVAYANVGRIKGAVFQSGPVDAYFTRGWQDTALHTKEYLMDFAQSRLYILGQPSVEAMLDFMPSMSLKPLLNQPTPPMLVIGGVHDTQNPFSDIQLLLQSGSPKYAWINPDGGHMGRSKDWNNAKILDQITMPWIIDRLNGR